MRTLAAAYSLRFHACLLYVLVFLCVYKAAGGSPFSSQGLVWGGGVYLAMQAAYLFNRLEDQAEDEFNGDVLRLAPGPRRAAKFFLAAVFALLAGLAMYFHRAARPVAIYSLAVIPLYSWPRLPLKRFMLFKPLSIALGFFLMSFFLPLSLASPGAFPDWRSIPALLYSNWQLPAVFFLNSVFLDLRDERGDALAGVVTLPVALGAGRAAVLLAASCAVLAIALFARGDAVPAAFSLFLAAASAGALRGPGRDYYNHVILMEDAVCIAALLA